MGALAGIFVAAMILGSITMSFDAFAAKDDLPKGQPFEQLDSRVSAVEESSQRSDSFFDVFFDVYTVDSFFDVFTELQANVDSFFDVFFEVETPTDACPEGEKYNYNSELKEWECLPDDFAVDSFFDVFFDITVDTQQNTEDISDLDDRVQFLEDDRLLTISNIGSSGEDGVSQEQLPESLQDQVDQIISLDLRGQSCGPGNALVGVDANGELVCEPVCTPENSELSCTDGIDNDCDGLTDCDDATCQSADLGATCSLPFEICDNAIDDDDDGHIDCSDPDCSADPVCSPPVDCDDGNVCTVDYVNSAGECVNDAAAANGNVCDDGFFCTSDESCNEGSCTGGVPTECPDGTCDEALDMCIVPSSTAPRVLDISTPSGIQTGPVAISYIVADQESDPVSIRADFLLSPLSGWQTATIHPTSDPIVGLTTTPSGTPYNFVWDSRADLSDSLRLDVIFRIIATDDTGLTSRGLITGVFSVDNR